MPLFAELAFPVEVDKVFTYAVPPELHDAVKPGVRALAPFGKRTAIGFVVGISDSSPVSRLKTLQDILDSTPVLSEKLLRLTKWIAEYYIVAWGEVLKAALPRGFALSGKRMVKVTADNIEKAIEDVSARSPRQAEILRFLAERGELSTKQLQQKVNAKSIYATLHGLEKQGYVTVSEREPGSAPKPKTEKTIEIDDHTRARLKEWKAALDHKDRRRTKQFHLIDTLLQMNNGTIVVRQLLKQSKTSLSVLQLLVEKEIITIAKREKVRSPEYDLYDAALGSTKIRLTRRQQEVLESIRSAVQENSFHTFLLHGVTGSGKTQVYIEAIREALASGKSAIVLVPEISLTPQIVQRFKYHFGQKVTALHSKMSAGERYDAWRLTREGRYSIVIGPRSAVFAPLNNLGLIVVDEEQEASYKQFDQTPRYHARDVAIMRANMAHAVVILGSATPSVESYFNAAQGKYTLLELPDRVDNAKLPDIQIIDLSAERRRRLTLFREERKKEFKRDPAGARTSKRKFEVSSISDALREKIQDHLARKEGVILLQNRRGFAPFVECLDCGFVETCDNCVVTLTYHLTRRQLRCHYCGFTKTPPNVCPQCKGIDLQLRGIGTQRVEEELKKLFPEASLVRMDLDTTVRKGSHETILRKFAEGDFDILLGTQMVAKGLDFSRVTLVGVVSADTQMLLPDFRSAERTFQLLTQVAGRAGRSGALSGEVIIQTSQPQHYSLKHVLAHDFKEFYREELQYRQELDYPPYSRIALIEARGERENEVMRHAERFSGLLEAHNTNFITLGPAPAVIPKLKNLYRWHIVLKGLKSADPAGEHMHQALRQALRGYENSAMGKSRRVRLVLDVDPVGMM